MAKSAEEKAAAKAAKEAEKVAAKAAETPAAPGTDEGTVPPVPTPAPEGKKKRDEPRLLATAGRFRLFEDVDVTFYILNDWNQKVWSGATLLEGQDLLRGWNRK